MITGHGDDAYNYPDGIIGDFSSNVPYSHHGTLVQSICAGRYLVFTTTPIHKHANSHKPFESIIT